MEVSPALIINLLALLSLLCISASASPVVLRDELPKLSDTLAVAKSPLEPITLAPSAPGARNEGLSEVARDTSKSESPERIQTTRSAFVTEQVKDLGLESENRSTSVEPAETNAATDSTDTEPPTSADSEQDSTTTKPEVANQSEKDSTTTQQPTTPSTTVTIPTTTTTANTTPAPEATVVEEQPSSPSSVDKVAISTVAPLEGVSTDGAKDESNSDAESNVTERPKQPAAEVPAGSEVSIPEAQTETPSAGTSGPPSVAPTTVAPEAPPTTTLEPTTTTETPITTPATKIIITEAPTNIEASTTSEAPATTSEAPATTSEAPATTSEAPATTSEAPATTSEAPATTSKSPELTTPTQISTTTTTAAPITSTSTNLPPEKKEEDAKSKGANCNHLPTYEGDEVQKVFREETTFKNGTIKGKFTYINFDQRYRLVHYTRLPYGPVKIDLVEELGRPGQNANGSVQLISGEAPNSVLQLRNILPNSLFGFPFVSPNAANNNNRVPTTDQRNGDSNDRSSPNHFYASPDLIDEQRNRQPNRTPPAQLDTFGQSFYENLPIGGAQLVQNQDSSSSLKPKQSEANQDGAQLPVSQNNPNSQFQYVTSAEANKPSQGLLYNYVSSPQPQFAPLPFYSFHQPAFYHHAAHQQLSMTPTINQQISYNTNKLKQEATLFSHQPHSHEHYVAPFMFAQPPSVHVAQPEASRLKLKVKTSKALNVHQGQEFLSKSAQYRTFSGPNYSAPVNSPAQIVHRQQRQRSGKQSHDLKPVINSTPVVYHVLRSPVGRIYSLPQYNQAHSIAYDQND